MSGLKDLKTGQVYEVHQPLLLSRWGTDGSIWAGPVHGQGHRQYANTVKRLDEGDKFVLDRWADPRMGATWIAHYWDLEFRISSDYIKGNCSLL
jgi:hypothetical protein